MTGRMARPREFDETEALDAAIDSFWGRGYEATSMRDLAAATGLTSASLYNAFGDKKALFQAALGRYVERGVAQRIATLRTRPPLEALRGFFDGLIARSLADPAHKGCLLVNSALDAAPHDPEIRAQIKAILDEIEGFLRERIAAGQADGSIAADQPAADLARQFLGLQMGIRVLARARPERALLEGLVRPAFAALAPRAKPRRRRRVAA
jgi:TetR/AcrR family transcriptional repressor of nem operon